VTFTPAGGAVTVAPGSCSTPICVTIPRPAGFTAQNATSCYAISFVNDSTGACQTRTGTIRADNTCWCITPAQSGIVSVPGRLAGGLTGIPVVIGIKYPCGPPIASPYRVIALPLNPDHPDPLALSLNGLPPGEPVFGTLSPDPVGGDLDVTVMVSYPHGYDSSAPYEIVLEADTDGDGEMERQCSTVVAATYDDTEVTGAPSGPPAVESVKLALAPNPFFTGSNIRFSLARAEDVDLGVYDLGGRLVRQLQHGRLLAGPHAIEWNGRDDGGRRAPAGVYFVRFSSPGRRMESKVVKLQ
jgi:hypothetical protein